MSPKAIRITLIARYWSASVIDYLQYLQDNQVLEYLNSTIPAVPAEEPGTGELQYLELQYL